MAKFDPSKTANASMIKNMQEKASAQANARTVIDIDINLVDGNPDNSDIFNMNEVERLAHTIKTDGFRGVVEVYRKPDGRYQLSSGHQRVEALRKLGRDKVPVVVKEMPQKATSVRRELILANIIARAITPMELARAIKYHKETYILEALEEKGFTGYDEVNIKENVNMVQIYELVAKDFGKSSRTIRYLEELNNLIPDLAGLVDNEMITWSIFTQKGVTRMPEYIQQRIYSEIMDVARGSYTADDGSSLTRKQVEECIARVLEQIRMEEELAKIREQSSKKQIEIPSSPQKAKEQLVESLKVDTKPTKKAIEIIQNSEYEEEEVIEEPIQNNREKIQVIAIPKRTADGILSAVASQLESLLKIEFGFSNEAEVMRYITAIEESIDIIKERLI